MIPQISQKTLDLQSGKRTRKKHLAMIRAIHSTQGFDAAARYWLSDCPRISKAAFYEAAR